MTFLLLHLWPIDTFGINSLKHLDPFYICHQIPITFSTLIKIVAGSDLAICSLKQN